MTGDMDGYALVLRKEVRQIRHGLLGLRQDIGLVGSEEEMLYLHFYTFLDMLHKEVEGVTHEMECIILRHISLSGEVCNIGSFGKRRLNKSIIRRLRGIKRHRILLRSQAYHSLDRRLRLRIVDIHT